MKKCIAVLLSVFMLVQMIPAVFAQTNAEVSLSSVTAECGETVKITVSVKNCVEAKSVYIVPDYDEEVLEIVSGKWLISGMLADDWSEAFGDAAIAFASNTDINTDVFELEFKVKDDAPGGKVAKVSCEIVIKTLEGQAEVDVPVTLTDGSVTVAAKACTHTDKTEVPAKAADCVNAGNNLYYVCDSCGVVLKADGVTETTVEAETIPALGHSFTEQTTEYLNTAADCCNAATYFYSCANPGCNEKGTDTFAYGEADPTKHTGNTEIRGAKEATKDEEGYTGDLYCKDCGALLEKGEVIPIPECKHQLVKTEAKAATCEQEGNIAYWTCTECGKIFADENAEEEIAAEATVITAKGHEFVNYSSDNNATCVADGTETATCENCAATDTRIDEGSKEDAPHSFPAEYTSDGNATCTADGTKSRICTLCSTKETVKDEGSALGHTPGAAVVENKIEASCGADGSYDEVVYCSVQTCGAELSRNTVTVPATGEHNYATETERKEPTCTEDGYVIKACGCGETEKTVLPATGHTAGEAVVENKVEATCGKDGSYDEVVYCQTCKAELSRETIVVKATGEHNYTTETERKDPTCTKDGYVIKACGCGATEKTVLPATGHTAGETVIENKVEATCGKDGSYDEVVYCQTCEVELSRETVVVKATGEHNYATETERKDPTCTEDGYVIKACGCGETEKTVLPATGHTAGEAVIENKVDATCTADGGYDKVVYCTTCNAELSREHVVVPATGHTAGETVIENKVEATCSKDGSYDEVVYCQTCKAELSRETIVVKATGEHYYATETERKEATCTEDGYVIMACGCGATEKTVLPATGHTAGETVIENKVEATCGEDGSYDEVIYCQTCNAELSRQTITETAQGHSYGEWIETIAATCTEIGKEIRTCATCSGTESREIAALGHDYESVVTDPTETEKGYTTHTCTVCGDSYVDSYVDPKPEVDKVPETGDMMTGGLWMSMMVLSLLGVGIVLSSRKKWTVK